MFNTVGLIGKHADDRVANTLERLVDFLRGIPVEILFDANSASTLPSFDLPVVDRDTLGKRCDLVIVVAGDGTFLGAARSLVEHDVRLLGINLGRLGFLTDIMPDEMTERLSEIMAGRFDEEERFLLHSEIFRAGNKLFEIDALNEVVAHKSNIARLIEFETHVDGQLVNRQRSDGLIVATPTGSTAYALSGGGPILHPSINAIVLVPICPHTLTTRPLVVEGGSEIEVVMGHADASDAQFTCDGQTAFELVAGDRLVIRRRSEALRLIHPVSYDYYATLRTKLHWGKEV